jgi:3-deoxy-D-manno-octulosonic-acid transferase
MGLLLDFGYLVYALLASPWLIARYRSAGGRLGLKSRLGYALGARGRRTIWLHGSSAGEIGLLKPLVELFERDMPEATLVVSAYSATGFAAARKMFACHRVIYFPFDFSFVVRRVLRHLDPRLIVIVEAELWPNFLRTADLLSVPVIVINGRMSDRSFRLHARTRLIPLLLRQLPLIAVQAEEHAERLRRLGVDARRVHVTGNMKYDTAKPGTAAQRDALRSAFGYSADQVVVIGGSLHVGEEVALLDAHAQLPARHGIAMILVPRYPQDAPRIMALVRARGYAAVCKTELDAPGVPLPAGALLVVDTVGELNALYAAADLAFVGGSLYYRGSNKGGHNLMEPAVLGLPVLFGPFNFSFKSIARALLDAGGGALVHDAAELGSTLAALVLDADRRHAMGDAARRVVLEGQGAAAKNYALIQALLRSGVATPHNASFRQ